MWDNSQKLKQNRESDSSLLKRQISTIPTMMRKCYPRFSDPIHDPLMENEVKPSGSLTRTGDPPGTGLSGESDQKSK